MKLRARILVADDQRDVATTLTAGLRDAGASVSYVTDGEEALRRVTAGGLDLLLLDMKMPPGDWGGLWLLTQFRHLGLTLPVVVLSGEGGQRQTIEAMRMGARDWVDKGAAGAELLDRCSGLLAEIRRESVAVAARTLPSPVAHDLSRYASTTGVERSTKHGLHALESVIRFSALLALADRDPRVRGIPGVNAAQFTRPSLGTWLTAARALASELGPDTPASAWLVSVLPDKSSLTPLQRLVKLRNDMSHGGHEPTEDEAEDVRICITDAAHRLASAWTWKLHEVVAMEFDGQSFHVKTRLHAGASASVPSAFRSPSPARTGDLILVGCEGRAIPMAPWVTMLREPPGAIGVYDTVTFSKRDSDDAPVHYVDARSRRRGLLAIDPAATWSRVSHHVDRT